VYEYENTRRIIYDEDMVFVPKCEKCGRFVRADDCVYINRLGELANQPNATCSKCGRIKMIFEGFMDADWL
jgi:ribosomal protein L32